MFSRIQNKIRRIRNNVMFNYAPRSTHFARKGSNTIFMYHGIDSNGSNRFNTRHTSKTDFEKQLIYLKKTSNILTLEDFFQEKFINGKPNVSITFDDGYLNNYTNAKPLLEKYEVPATVFVTGINRTEDHFLWADFVDAIHLMNQNKLLIGDQVYQKINGIYTNNDGQSIYYYIKNIRADYTFKQLIYSQFPIVHDFLNLPENGELSQLMNDEQIISLSQSPFVQIGSHGFYHNNLNKIPLNEVIHELQASKEYLEGLVNYEINTIGYPDGGYTDEVKDAAEKVGFTYQLATDHYQNPETDRQDKRIMNRKGIYNCDSWGNQLIL